MKGILAIVLGSVIVVAVGWYLLEPTVLTPPTEEPRNLFVAFILKKVQTKYSAMNSYSCQGTVAYRSTFEERDSTFSMRMTRPNRFRLQWKTEEDVPYGNIRYPQHTLWSTGAGLLLLDNGEGAVQQMKNWDDVDTKRDEPFPFINPTVFSLFLQDPSTNPLSGNIQQDEPAQDDWAGGALCYVFAQEKDGVRLSFWIGKQDLLIHQFQLFYRGDPTNIMTYAGPGSQRGDKVPPKAQRDTSTTETYTNIVVNPTLSAHDFGP